MKPPPFPFRGRPTHRGRALRTFLPLSLAAILAACGQSPVRPRTGAASALWEVRHQNHSHLPDPGEREVVVVLNYNSPAGNHAGLWAGPLLADPAGSYLAVRRWDRNWSGPSLTDYVRYQMEDGDRVLSYRFTLPEDEFETIRQRILQAGPTTPLFCGAAVQNLIAGIGPFARVPAVYWSSPAELADHLAPLHGQPDSPGVCQWPDGEAC